MGEDTRNLSSAVRSPLLSGLRAFLTSYVPDPLAQPVPPLLDVRRNVVRVHNLYQRASYSSAARLLPEALRQATELASRTTGMHRASAFQLLAAAYIAASKLATKVGDGHSALLTADRASTAARLTDHHALTAVAAYQAACGLLRLPGRVTEAAQVTQNSIKQLVRGKRMRDPDLLSAHGALLLLAAVIAARQGRTKDTDQLLTQAERLATELGSDQNRLWTGFGPTNVAIHGVSAAVERHDADRAIGIAGGVDLSRLPTALVGRRAQVHLDLAVAAAMASDGRSLAVLHILEAERVAPEVVRVNAQAQTLLLDLLSKDRRAATPGLRPLAERAGLLA